MFDNNFLELNNNKNKISATFYLRLGAMLLGVVFLVVFLTTQVFMRVVVNGSSMEDTLYHGDDLWAFRTSNCEADDIIVFLHDIPSDNTGDIYLIKRVVAVAGETVYIKDGTIFVKDVNGNERVMGTGKLANMDEVLVGDNCVFVVGDNYVVSYDSREFGAISLDTVAGVILI